MLTGKQITERLDQLYEHIAHRPRSVIAAGAGLGVTLALAVTLPRLPAAAPAQSPAASPSAAPLQSGGALEPLAVVGAYNAASIAAAATGDASLVLPFFTADSREPDAIRAEFARRAAHDEQHQSSLVRWGVAEQRIRGSSASIVTQEVWDDQVFRGGERVDSRRGTIVRIRYSLSRTSVAAPWRIQTIKSTTVVP